MSARVAVLLSTFNGARYLPEQLESLLLQSHRDWTLFWRDDGSSDGTLAVMAGFAARVGADRCVHVAALDGRLGVPSSYLTLLQAALPALRAQDAVAFSDQDDVWLPAKLARGVAALAAAPADTPALYCARQILVDAQLRRIGMSPAFHRPPGFPASLTQNMATGCTVLLNRAAAALIARSHPPSGTLHDWWSFLLVTASGGLVLADDEPVLLYRQHGGNVVGAHVSVLRRALAAARRGPRPFMTDFRRHLDALAAHAPLLTPAARRDVATLQRAVAGGALARLAALRLPGLRRNHVTEGWLFRLWFLIG